MYLERRRRRWYALHDIPEDAQRAIGRKRFVQSLETEDQHVAKRRAAPLAVKWLAAIDTARRSGPLDPIERDAGFWRKLLDEAPPEEKGLYRSLIGDEAEARVHRAATQAGFMDEREEGYDDLPAHEDAARFVALATGQLVKLDEHLEEYLATLRNERKTVDMKRATIKRFAESFIYVTDVKRKEVQGWVNARAAAGNKPATLKRTLSELRGYWTYLQSIEVAAEDFLPLEKLLIPKPGKEAKADEREPFEAADVVKLWRAAANDGDQLLADLIELGMWTGARIEELCALRIERAKADHLNIQDAKTDAGWRQVPIHSQLKKTVQRLLNDREDGYLLEGLTENKYGDRSNAIGKRFGRLKTSMGFGPNHVFHSIRHTVSTLLEDAGVPENVAADILGHDKPNITYGLYSGGASLKTKMDAVEKLRYGELA